MKCVTGAFEEFGSVSKRELPCYPPGSFTSSGPDLLHKNIAFIEDRDSFSYRQNSKALIEKILRRSPFAEYISNVVETETGAIHSTQGS